MISDKFRPSILVPKTNVPSTGQYEFLTDELFLEGIIMRACSAHEIYHTNTFMVKIENGEKAASERYHKIQDKVFLNAYAKICCDEKLCNRNDCLKGDSDAAAIVVEDFDKLKDGTLAKNLSIKNVTIVDPATSDYAPGYARKGIRYICQQTGYTEIAFPVRLYDRVMGAFIVGQIIAEKNKDIWRETIEQKCRNAGYDDNKTAQIIQYTEEFKTDEEMEEIVKKVSMTVDDIEKDLKTVYADRQKQYALEQGNMYVERFKQLYKAVKSEMKDTAQVFPAVKCIEVYNKLGQCIRDCISEFCKVAGIEKYALYLPDEVNLTENDYKQLMYGNVKLNIQALTAEYLDQTSLYGKDLVSRYVSDAELPYDYIILSESEGYPIALLLCIEEFLQEVGSGEEKELLRECLSNIFKHIFSYVQTFGIQEKAEYFRAYLDSSMSIMRHELGQSNAGYQTLLEKFKTNVSRYAENTFDWQRDYKQETSYEFLENCENFIKDSEKYLHTTKIRIDSTRYLTEFEPKTRQYFYPYEEFLFKWRQIYYKTAEENNLVFEVPRITHYDPVRPRMYGDPMMVEQAVYNLTNNAIKYAMQGTRVSLDCKLSDDKTRYEIVVKNISYPISKDEENMIFEYGRRGSNNQKAGSGLGLYLTRQIALAHGGNVYCNVKKLSDYNWFLLRAYIQLYEDKNISYFCKDQTLYEILKEEWDKKNPEITKYIVREFHRNAFSAMYVQQNIRRGTAEFTFTFWLPQK